MTNAEITKEIVIAAIEAKIYTHEQAICDGYKKIHEAVTAANAKQGNVTSFQANI